MLPQEGFADPGTGVDPSVERKRSQGSRTAKRWAIAVGSVGAIGDTARRTNATTRAPRSDENRATWPVREWSDAGPVTVGDSLLMCFSVVLSWFTGPPFARRRIG